MSGQCASFATKPEVEIVASKVRLKLDKNEALKIQQAGVTQSVGIAQTLIQSSAQVITAKVAANAYVTSQAINKVNSVVKTAGEANNIALKAANSAKQAKFDALYARTRASAARAAAAKNSSSIGNALGKIGGFISIVSTLATATALAALQQQVLDISRRVKSNREIHQSNKRRIKDLDFFAKQAEARADRAYEERQRILKEQGKQRVEINFLIEESRRANKENRLINLQNKQTFFELKKQTNIAKTSIKQSESNLSKKIAENSSISKSLEQSEKNATTSNINPELLTKKILELESKVSRLQSANQTQRQKIDKLENPEQLITRVRNLNDKVTKYDADLFKIGDKTIQLESSFTKEKREGYVRAQEALKRVNEVKQRQIEDIKRNDVKVKQVEKNISKVQQKQVNDINSKLDINSKQVADVNDKVSKLPTVTQIAIAVGGLEILRQIKDKKSSVSPCQAPVLVPPVAAQAKANNVLTRAFQVTNTAQNLKIQQGVNVINTAVNHPAFGLKAIQGYAQTAWKATHADKILSAINTVMTVHNGMMLSTNLSVTVTEAASVALNAAGLKDSEGKPFDVTAIAKSKISALINSLGIANDLNDFKAKLAPYNRIYQATANAFDAARDLFDNAVSTAEAAAENTGKIGNALIDARVVYEDAYDKMVDEFTADTRATGAFTRFRAKLEAIENVTSTVENIAQNTISTQDAYKQLGDSAKDWKEAKKAVVDKKKEDDTETKKNSEIKADIAKPDFEPAPPED